MNPKTKYFGAVDGGTGEAAALTDQPHSNRESTTGALILETEIPTLGSVCRPERLFIATGSIIDAKKNRLISALSE